MFVVLLVLERVGNAVGSGKGHRIKGIKGQQRPVENISKRLKKIEGISIQDKNLTFPIHKISLFFIFILSSLALSSLAECFPGPFLCHFINPFTTVWLYGLGEKYLCIHS